MNEPQPSSVSKLNPPKASVEGSKDPSETSPRLFLLALGIILVLVEAVMYHFFKLPPPPTIITPPPIRIPTSTPIPTLINIPTMVPTNTEILPNCILWSSLTSADVGNSRCIYGRIVKIYSTDVYRQIIRFSVNAGTFLIWDRNVSKEVSVNQCIAAEGYIHQDASELYMEISGTTIIDYPRCP